MAFVKTDDTHYHGIADEIRGMHGNPTTYTPPEMVDFLNKGRANLTPLNIRAGITIMGVTGTMQPKPTAEVPEDFVSVDSNHPDPGSIEDAKEQYKSLTESDEEVDVLILVDNSGNVTYGFLSPGEPVCKYGTQALPAPPAWWDRDSYPYAVVVKGLTEYRLVLCQNRPYTTSSGNSNVKVDGAYLISVPRRDSAYARWTEPEAGEDFYETTSALWASEDLLDANGAVALAGSEPELLGYFNGFKITSYDPETTEFKALGWWRLSWHTTGEYAGQWTCHDFTSKESSGGNFLNHTVSCTRSALYLYRRGKVWPDVTDDVTYDYHGVPLPVMPAWDRAAYPYSIVFGADRGAAYYYDTVVSNRPFRYIYSDNAGEFQIITGDICKYQQYRTSADNRETLYRAASSGTQVYITPGQQDFIWADHHIFNEYGGIWYEATDPIPIE
ncbi:MAG: hypothetical protein IJE22_01660 [Oscillibacter sp.]|nr:hypothetical protein [Oscillibacter sp.]